MRKALLGGLLAVAFLLAPGVKQAEAGFLEFLLVSRLIDRGFDLADRASFRAAERRALRRATDGRGVARPSWPHWGCASSVSLARLCSATRVKGGQGSRACRQRASQPLVNGSANADRCVAAAVVRCCGPSRGPSPA